MARGGSRQGRPGVSYSNRSDLMNKPRLEAVPPTPAAPPTPATGQPAPPNLVPLGAPSQRPAEPVTHGVGAGAGPGPLEAGLMPPGGGDPVAEQLMAVYAAFPNDDLGDLISAIKAGDYARGGLFGPSAF